MLTDAEIKARKMIIEDIFKRWEKIRTKMDKEANRTPPYVTCKGVRYFSEFELQDAYSCDVIDCSTYERLSDKLYNRKLSIYNPGDDELLEALESIKDNIEQELIEDERDKRAQAKKDEIASDLAKQGYSYKEIINIMENED